MKRHIVECVAGAVATVAFVLGFWFVAGHQYAADIQADMQAETAP